MNAKYFVPFETAKQLKEKGYPQAWATMYYGTFDGETILLTDRESASCVVEGDEDSPVFEDWSESYYAAPTYHEVVDWLEGKGMCIICYAPTIRQPNRRYKASVFIDNTIDWRICNTTYPTREEALNAAILEALEMI